MPKLTWMKQSPPKNVNHLAALLREYKRAQGITSAQMGAALGYVPETVRQQLRKPPESWKVMDLIRYCDLLQVPLDEAIEAIKKSSPHDWGIVKTAKNKYAATASVAERK